MLFLLFSASLLFTCVFSSPVPGYDLHGLDIYSPPLIKAPLIHAPIYEPAPIIAAPIYKAPILAHPPIIKTIIPATSYASVTSYVSHPYKTIIAAPPILKYAAPLPIAIGHGYH